MLNDNIISSKCLEEKKPDVADKTAVMKVTLVSCTSPDSTKNCVDVSIKGNSMIKPEQENPEIDKMLRKLTKNVIKLQKSMQKQSEETQKKNFKCHETELLPFDFEEIFRRTQQKSSRCLNKLKTVDSYLHSKKLDAMKVCLEKRDSDSLPEVRRCLSASAVLANPVEGHGSTLFSMRSSSVEYLINSNTYSLKSSQPESVSQDTKCSGCKSNTSNRSCPETECSCCTSNASNRSSLVEKPQDVEKTSYVGYSELRHSSSCSLKYMNSIINNANLKCESAFAPTSKPAQTSDVCSSCFSHVKSDSVKVNLSRNSSRKCSSENIRKSKESSSAFANSYEDRSTFDEDDSTLISSHDYGESEGGIKVEAFPNAIGCKYASGRSYSIFCNSSPSCRSTSPRRPRPINVPDFESNGVAGECQESPTLPSKTTYVDSATASGTPSTDRSGDDRRKRDFLATLPENTAYVDSTTASGTPSTNCSEEVRRKRGFLLDRINRVSLGVQTSALETKETTAQQLDLCSISEDTEIDELRRKMFFERQFNCSCPSFESSELTPDLDKKREFCQKFVDYMCNDRDLTDRQNQLMFVEDHLKESESEVDLVALQKKREFCEDFFTCNCAEYELLDARQKQEFLEHQMNCSCAETTGTSLQDKIEFCKEFLNRECYQSGMIDAKGKRDILDRYLYPTTSNTGINKSNVEHDVMDVQKEQHYFERFLNCDCAERDLADLTNKQNYLSRMGACSCPSIDPEKELKDITNKQIYLSKKIACGCPVLSPAQELLALENKQKYLGRLIQCNCPPPAVIQQEERQTLSESASYVMFSDLENENKYLKRFVNCSCEELVDPYGKGLYIEKLLSCVCKHETKEPNDISVYAGDEGKEKKMPFSDKVISAEKVECTKKVKSIVKLVESKSSLIIKAKSCEPRVTILDPKIYEKDRRYAMYEPKLSHTSIESPRCADNVKHILVCGCGQNSNKPCKCNCMQKQEAGRGRCKEKSPCRVKCHSSRSLIEPVRVRDHSPPKPVISITTARKCSFVNLGTNCGTQGSLDVSRERHVSIPNVLDFARKEHKKHLTSGERTCDNETKPEAKFVFSNKDVSLAPDMQCVQKLPRKCSSLSAAASSIPVHSTSHFKDLNCHFFNDTLNSNDLIKVQLAVPKSGRRKVADECLCAIPTSQHTHCLPERKPSTLASTRTTSTTLKGDKRGSYRRKRSSTSQIDCQTSAMTAKGSQPKVQVHRCVPAQPRTSNTCLEAETPVIHQHRHKHRHRTSTRLQEVHRNPSTILFSNVGGTPQVDSYSHASRCYKHQETDPVQSACKTRNNCSPSPSTSRNTGCFNFCGLFRKKNPREDVKGNCKLKYSGLLVDIN